MPGAIDTKSIKVGNYIYVVGGYDYQNSLNSFYRFSLLTSEWEVLPDLKVPISANSLVLHDNKIYSFGDYKDLSAVWAYDLDKKEWARADLPYSESRHNAAVVIGKTAYIIGGNLGAKGPFLREIQEISL